MAVDMGTVMVCYSLCTVICSAAIGIRWLQFKARYRGMGFWFAACLLQLLGLVLVMLRGRVPDIISMTAANGAIVLCFVFLVRGFIDFYGGKRRQAMDWAAFAVFLAVHAWFTFARPDLRAREIALSLAMVYFSARAILGMAGTGGRASASARGAIAVFSAFAILSAIRIGIDLAGPAESDFMAAPSVESWIMVCYLCVFLGLTLVVMGMPSRRILEEEKERVKEKEALMAAIRESEEIRSRAFLASPDAISISRLDDGRFIEVNDSFCEVFGYSRSEAFAARLPDLALEKGALEGIAKEAMGVGLVRNLDMFFVRKGGESLRSSYSGTVIELKGEKHLLSIIGGTKGVDRTEMVLRARLNLWDFSFGHSVQEFMVKALDEIEAMTRSRIGFYHFMDEETGKLSLQAWSTSTTDAFCRADARGQHYPLEQAGVWADAIRRRKPVIHNDYASMPGKKGMPEGHAEVRRELVAPTFREGRIVAILGVGNKSVDYTEADVSLVSYVADLVWTIVSQRRAEERIRELNGKLEQLAMRDELTGMANRRAFFAVAGRDFQKAKRYSTSIAFIMMDIDRFKDVNDENGHDVGDAALAKVAQTIIAGVRDVDVAARLGGEEFGILMPFTDEASAKAIAERIRRSVEESCAEIGGKRIGATVSAGVAADGSGQGGLEELMRRADVALYRAKNAGRNRIETG